MIAYSIHYRIKGDKNGFDYSMLVDAKSAKSAKTKIEKKLTKNIIITNVVVLGYY